jgi:hypothetical protein
MPIPFTAGVNVAVGADGIVVGAGTGSVPRVRVFSPSGTSLIHDFFAYPEGFFGGVFVADGPPLPSANGLLTDLTKMVQSLMDSGAVLPGDGQPLLAKLRAAAGPLNAFTNQVRALVKTGRIPPPKGQGMIDLADAIIQKLHS